MGRRELWLLLRGRHSIMWDTVTINADEKCTHVWIRRQLGIQPGGAALHCAWLARKRCWHARTHLTTTTTQLVQCLRVKIIATGALTKSNLKRIHPYQERRTRPLTNMLHLFPFSGFIINLACSKFRHTHHSQQRLIKWKIKGTIKSFRYR